MIVCLLAMWACNLFETLFFNINPCDKFCYIKKLLTVLSYRCSSKFKFNRIICTITVEATCLWTRKSNKLHK